MREKIVFGLKVLGGFALVFGFLALALWDRSQSPNTNTINTILSAGYRCESISASRSERTSSKYHTLFADCGDDGFYEILTSSNGETEVLKR